MQQKMNRKQRTTLVYLQEHGVEDEQKVEDFDSEDEELKAARGLVQTEALQIAAELKRPYRKQQVDTGVFKGEKLFIPDRTLTSDTTNVKCLLQCIKNAKYKNTYYTKT